MINITEYLTAHKDEKYKSFHGSLCPGSSEMIGVRVPDLRECAKLIVKSGEAEEYLGSEKGSTYEERVIEGLVIGYSKLDPFKKLDYIRAFIPRIDSWAVCDICCSGFKFAKKIPDAAFDFILDYIYSEKEFEVRFAVVMLMDYYLDEIYFDEAVRLLKSVRHKGYYAEMAVAWAIQAAFVKNPEKIKLLLKEKVFDKFTQNKAISKICDSYRVSDEDKAYVKSLRISD